MYKVLIIEDDKSLRKYLENILSKSYEVEVVDDFINILEKIKLSQFDLVLLDLTLPNMYGENLISVLKKQNKEAKIVIMTSDDTKESEYNLLSLDVEDYFKKPLDPDILLLKVAKILKYQTGILTYGDMKVDSDKMLLNDTVKLTKNDLIILLFLIKNNNKEITYKTLLKQLWENDEFVEKSALMMALARLRKKTEKINCNAKIITIRGKGVILK